MPLDSPVLLSPHHSSTIAELLKQITTIVAQEEYMFYLLRMSSHFLHLILSPVSPGHQVLAFSFILPLIQNLLLK